VLFENGRVVDLRALPGAHESFASEIDDRGQVGGASSAATPDPFSFFGWGTQTRGFVSQRGAMQQLRTTGDCAHHGWRSRRMRQTRAVRGRCEDLSTRARVAVVDSKSAGAGA
jgi:hypothetical protein